MKGMQCTCGKTAKLKTGLRFQNHTIDGWVCQSCGEVFYNPEQSEKILLLNKVKKRTYTLKLSQVKSNLILHIPKEVSDALNLRKGEAVQLGVDENATVTLHKIKE